MTEGDVHVRGDGSWFVETLNGPLMSAKCVDCGAGCFASFEHLGDATCSSCRRPTGHERKGRFDMSYRRPHPPDEYDLIVKPPSVPDYGTARRAPVRDWKQVPHLGVPLIAQGPWRTAEAVGWTVVAHRSHEPWLEGTGRISPYDIPLCRVFFRKERKEACCTWRLMPDRRVDVPYGTPEWYEAPRPKWTDPVRTVRRTIDGRDYLLPASAKELKEYLV